MSYAKATNDYLTTFSYDKNGNLLKLVNSRFSKTSFLEKMNVILSREDRNGYGTELDMDRFTYNYLTINGERSNRLDFVQDIGTDYVNAAGVAVYDDIKTGQTSGNYKYNRIGELTEDVQEGMKLYWRYGDHKLRLIERTDQDSPEVEFFYNPLGVRVGKLVKPRQNGQLEAQENWTYYYYGYDANGQLMAVYDSKLYATNGETILEEQYIYGSDRIGVIKKGLTVFENGAIAPSSNPYVENTLGQKRYELKNYLGTVNVTISDRKTYNGTEDVFESVVTNYAETYAFGMLSDTYFSGTEKFSRTNPDKYSSGLMPNRSLNADGQKHLFHGMEHDGEVSGSGNSYTTEFRQYDPRLGRWKSLDPLMWKYPNQSPYAAFNNNPIYFNDPLGLEGEPPGGLPENPNDMDVAPGDDGKNYQWDNENESWVRLHDEATVTGDVHAHYTQKIANIKKELVQVYIRELMFESHKRNDGGDDEGENWFFGTLRYLDEQFDKLKGERREQSRGVQLKTEDGIEFGSNKDLPKSKNPDIPDFDYQIIDDLGKILKAKREIGGVNNKMKNRADLIRELNALYRQQKTAIGKVDEDGVKSYQEYYEPHPNVKGDSIRIKINEKGDTSRYEHTRTDPNNFLNYWKEIKK